MTSIITELVYRFVQGPAEGCLQVHDFLAALIHWWPLAVVCSMVGMSSLPFSIIFLSASWACTSYLENQSLSWVYCLDKFWSHSVYWTLFVSAFFPHDIVCRYCTYWNWLFPLYFFITADKDWYLPCCMIWHQRYYLVLLNLL